GDARIKLNSPSVQCCAELVIFPLDKCGFPSAVNDAFLSFRIRDKKAARMKCAMKRAAASSILVSVMLLAVAVMAEAQQPTKVPRIGYVTGTREPTWDAPDANRDAS